jgi:5-methylcytosine-specific restriction protein A
MPTAQDFITELQAQLRAAESKGIPHVDIASGDLHRKVGDYPHPIRHRMKICCRVMYGEQRPGDRVLRSPPKGNGATLIIRYTLPR